MKKRILYILLGVMLSFQGWGQSFTLASNSYSVSSTPINYNCSSVTFDFNNNTSGTLVFDVYSSNTGLPGSYNQICSNTVSSNNTNQLSFYSIGTIYYYAEVNSSPTYTSSIYQVEVRSKPTRPVITSNTPICEGSNLIFSTANVSGGTFSWTGVNGFSSSVQNPTISSATTSASGSYSATVTVNGCTSPSSSLITTNVYAIPTSPTLTSPTICDGNTATMLATATRAGTYTYTWTVPTGVTAPGNVSTFTTTKAGTYSVTITDNNGCKSAGASGIVTVNLLPTAPTLTSPTICDGNTATMLATATPAGTYTYTWTVPTGVTAPGNVSTFTTTKAGTYSVTITDNNGCTSAGASGIVTVNALPNVVIAASKSSLCLGESTTLTASGASTFLWSGGETTNSITITPTSSLSFSVKGTDGAGCFKTTSKNIIVNPIPTILPITATTNTLIVGTSLLLNTSASGGTSPYSLPIFTVSDLTVAAMNGSNLNGLKQGNVSVMYSIKDVNNCSSSFSSLFNVTVLPAEMKFEIPNAFIPTDIYSDNRYLKASYNTSVKHVNYFRVFNRMGNLVYEVQNADPSAIKWDGTYNNVMQESDAYMWIAEITGLGTITFERKSGQFLLLK